MEINHMLLAHSYYRYDYDDDDGDGDGGNSGVALLPFKTNTISLHGYIIS